MVTFLCFALKKFFGVKFFLTVLDDRRGGKGERARERFGPSGASTTRELIRGPGGAFPVSRDGFRCPTRQSGGMRSAGREGAGQKGSGTGQVCVERSVLAKVERR